MKNVVSEFPGQITFLKQQQLDKYKYIIEALIPSGDYDYFHTTKDYIEYVNNFNVDNFEESDVVLISDSNYTISNLLIVTNILYDTIKEEKVDLVKLNSRLEELSKIATIKIQKYIDENKKYKKYIDEVFNNMPSNLCFLVHLDPETFNLKTPSAENFFCVNFKTNEIIDDYDDETVEYQINKAFNFTLELTNEDYCKAKYGKKYDSLTKQIVKILNLYPFATPNELSHIIQNAENINIFDYLIANTAVHEMNTIIYDKYQYQEDHSASEQRYDSLMFSKQIADKIKVNGETEKEILKVRRNFKNISTEDIIKRIDMLIDDNFVIHAIEEDFYAPPYIDGRNTQRDYLIINPMRQPMLATIFKKDNQF